MSSIRKPSVLVDTSFLITLYGKDRENHKIASQYLKYFIANSIEMKLSTIVISEFQQMQPVVDLINSGNYMVLPYNYDDSIATADISYNVGSTIRNSDRAEFKDDLKIMGQAKAENIDYIITDDESTLAKYCRKLNKASMFTPKVIVLKDGFDINLFSSGQRTLLVE